jgi:hypothetical protein
MADSQRMWINQFLDRWFSAIGSEHGCSEEVFMQMETVQKNKELSDRFYANLFKERPLVGHSVSSMRQPPKGVPTDEEIEQVRAGKKKFDYHAMSTCRACWLRGNDTAAFRDAYMGFGGMTILVLPQSEENKTNLEPMRRMISTLKLPAFMRDEPVLKTLVEGLDPERPLDPPPVIRNHPAMVQMNSMIELKGSDPNKKMQRLMFGFKSKEAFGKPLKNDPAYPGISFVLPRLASGEILHSTAEERASWFELFTAYLMESPEDEGMLLLAKADSQPQIVQVLESLRKDGYQYWEG